LFFVFRMLSKFLLVEHEAPNKRAQYFRDYRKKNGSEISKQRKKQRKEKQVRVSLTYAFDTMLEQDRISGEEELRRQHTEMKLLQQQHLEEMRRIFERENRRRRRAKWESLMDNLERKMKDVTSTECVRFTLGYNFSVGFTANYNHLKGFTEHPHNIEEGIFTKLGRCMKDPMEKNYAKWKKELYLAATELFRFIIPEFVDNQYVIQFSKMSHRKHEVPLHLDDHDITHQYTINFGDWTGADLVCYNSSDKSNMSVVSKTCAKRRLLKFDGRLYHEVETKDFQGVRYSCIIYQLWNETVLNPTPIIPVPMFVDIFDGPTDLSN
jgi:hypothetical protein